MVFSAVLGSTVLFDVLGHSAVNGAPIPEDADVSLTSNAPEVATIFPTVAAPAGGGDIKNSPGITLVATGSTDIGVSVSPKDGTGPFVDTATLLVTPLPIPGLVRVELVLHN